MYDVNNDALLLSFKLVNEQSWQEFHCHLPETPPLSGLNLEPNFPFIEMMEDLKESLSSPAGRSLVMRGRHGGWLASRSVKLARLQFKRNGSQGNIRQGFDLNSEIYLGGGNQARPYL